MTPFSAATHTDPYAYYAFLRQQNTLLFDADLRVWIASGAEVVEAILAHPDCRVRPLHELVPPAIATGAAGQIFGRLMRMNEGPQHACVRQAVEPALAAVELKKVASIVARIFEAFENPLDNLNELMFRLPVSVVATLLGFAPRQVEKVARLTHEFVACLSPLSDRAQLLDADSAAVRLSQMFDELLSSDVHANALLNRIGREIDASACAGNSMLIANLVGLLSQACEATAGLIGNTLIALHRDPVLVEQVLQDPVLVVALVEEVARHDSPVQNTRRFVAKRCAIAGSILDAGDTIILLLGAANRDPWANPDPDNLLLERARRRSFAFGAGTHQCPGQQLAFTIASATISLLLNQQPAAFAQPWQWEYLPSVNGRIPHFHPRKEAGQ